MCVYIIAQLIFTDRVSYDRYKSRFLGVLRAFDGQLLVADENPQVLEGTWTSEKLIVLSFPDEAAAFEFSNSPEYKEIAKDRIAGAKAIVLLAKGIK